MTPDPERRGSGMTTAQMKAAPQGAAFIWCNCFTAYPRQLAHVIGRTDLAILPLSALEFGADRLRGLDREIVVDHAVATSDRIRAGLEIVDRLNSRRPGGQAA